jgi:hypothetical protein
LSLLQTAAENSSRSALNQDCRGTGTFRRAYRARPAVRSVSDEPTRGVIRALQTDHFHNPLAAVRSSLRADLAPKTESEGTPSPQERALAQALCGRGRSCHCLEADHGRSLVQWERTHGGKVDIVSDTAIWRSRGLPTVPLRWVVFCPPRGGFET